MRVPMSVLLAAAVAAGPILPGSASAQDQQIQVAEARSDGTGNGEFCVAYDPTLSDDEAAKAIRQSLSFGGRVASVTASEGEAIVKFEDADPSANVVAQATAQNKSQYGLDKCGGPILGGPALVAIGAGVIAGGVLGGLAGAGAFDGSGGGGINTSPTPPGGPGPQPTPPSQGGGGGGGGPASPIQ